MNETIHLCYCGSAIVDKLTLSSVSKSVHNLEQYYIALLVSLELKPKDIDLEYTYTDSL